jgi:hypothetical protein
MVDFGDGVVKSLAGFIDVVFFRTDAVAAGQAVNSIENSEQSVCFNCV